MGQIVNEFAAHSNQRPQIDTERWDTKYRQLEASFFAHFLVQHVLESEREAMVSLVLPPEK